MSPRHSARSPLGALLTLALLAVLAAAAGCVGSGSAGSTGTFARMSLHNFGIVGIDEARLAKGALYLKVRVVYFDETGLGTVHLVARASDETVEEAKGKEDFYDIMNVEFLSTDEWRGQSADLPNIPVYDEKRWKQVGGIVGPKFLTEIPGQGTLVDIGERDEFVWRDEAGDWHSARLEDKPADVQVGVTLSAEDLVPAYLETIESMQRADGEEARSMVFLTGNRGYDEHPFVFVDLDYSTLVLLQFDPADAEVDQTGGGRGKSAKHLTVDSTVYALVTQPFSSMGRLVTFTGNTTVDIVKSPSLKGFEPEDVPPLSGGPGMDLEAWEHELDELIKRPASSGTVRYLIGGGEFFTALIEAIQAAEDRIWIRTYIFDNDDYAVMLADLLKRRSPEVDVRVMFDGLGSIMAANANPPTMPPDFIQPESIESYLKDESDVKVRKRRNPWGTGDHTKTTLIDDDLVFTGGMNLGREYRYEWHDLMMEVRGPVVDEIRERFERSWAHAGFWGDFGYFFHELFTRRDRREAGPGVPLRVLVTTTGFSEIYLAQLAAIRRAQNYIWIENAYFADEEVLVELVKARHRGVDVRVILPSGGNHGIMNKSNMVAANVLYQHGCKVYFYSGMAHVKAAIYDGWACLGSANFDKLSFRVNQELNLGFSDPETVGRLIERLFEPDMAGSAEMTEPFDVRLSDQLAKIIATQL